jgi:hypothetical protein
MMGCINAAYPLIKRNLRHSGGPLAVHVLLAGHDGKDEKEGGGRAAGSGRWLGELVEIVLPLAMPNR